MAVQYNAGASEKYQTDAREKAVESNAEGKLPILGKNFLRKNPVILKKPIMIIAVKSCVAWKDARPLPNINRNGAKSRMTGTIPKYI